ncbi:alkyl hydroperoxide reductase/ Thiol specific antioxidant/ Mal allergen [mine drainage metagenome]|uniref:Alkyl hydroperoxide reductase/ Thiol specific antioxidant/ Mal allergen n=1 Tax=mine drainage metagenome TaxID=410659 RepID=T0YMR9_9ZZZZ
MHSLHELRGARGTLLAFLCNHCPYVQAVLPRLLRDARELAPLGVNVIAINPNDAEAYPEDSYARMVELARDWPFPYLHDATQAIARAYGAVCTPDFFGCDAALRLRYRGVWMPAASSRSMTRRANCSRPCSASPAGNCRCRRNTRPWAARSSGA